MAFRDFRIGSLVRIVFLMLSLTCFIYLLLDTEFYATSGVLGLAVVLQVAELLHYVEKTKRDIARYLQSIRHADVSQLTRPIGAPAAMPELQRVLAELNADFREARLSGREREAYLEMIVRHVGIGLLVYDEGGEVRLFNAAAKKMLNVYGVRRISDLEARIPALARSLELLRPGERTLLPLEIDGEPLQLSILLSMMRTRDGLIHLVSLQNIQGELEERELDSWRKLIRVLTHEIMNSITPITSLAGTAGNLLREAASVEASGAELREQLEDIELALETIENRGRALMEFVDAYRDLTRVPTPVVARFEVQGLLQRVQRLAASRPGAAGVAFDCRVRPPGLELLADSNLIEQALINLVQNSLDVLEGRPDSRVELSAGLDRRGRVSIEVRDNGPGIPEELRTRVFVPFLTTRERGTGVGMTLARQIMRAHGGGISLGADASGGALVKLYF